MGCSHLVTALFLSDQRQVVLHNEVMLPAEALQPSNSLPVGMIQASAGGFSLLPWHLVTLQHILI